MPLIFRLVPVLLVFLFSAPAYSQDLGPDSNAMEYPVFGPVITYKDTNATELSFNYFTGKNEKCGIYFYGDKTDGLLRLEDHKQNWHREVVKAGGNSRVFYKIASKEKALKNAGGVVTIRDGKSIRFAVYGDTLAEKDKDYRLNQRICREIAQHGPQFIIHTGDIVYDSTDRWEWMRFFRSSASIMTNTVYLPALGNHDLYTPLWRKIFDVPDFHYPFYFYGLQGVDVMVMDSGLYFGRDSMQYRWLTNRLALADARGGFKVVVVHVPPFSSTSHRDEPANIALTNIIVPVLERYHVHLVLSGHDHLYERLEKNGVTYITTGGGAEDLDKANYDNPYRVKLLTRENHYLIVEIKKGVLTGGVYDMNHELVDGFEIKK